MDGNENKLKIVAPEVVPEPDWTPIIKLPNFGKGQSFLWGDGAKNRLRVAYFMREEDKTVCAKAWFGWAAEGPPGHAHGGSILTVFDEAMGIATWMMGYLTLAASVTADFRRKVPLGTDATIEARVYDVERRKVYTEAKMYDPADNHLLAEAKGLYVMQEMAQITDETGRLLRSFQA